jgi:hypothetical protein
MIIFRMPLFGGCDPSNRKRIGSTRTDFERSFLDHAAQLNDRVSGIWEGARRSLFDELESPALKKLPDEPYLYAEWKGCKGAACGKRIAAHIRSSSNRRHTTVRAPFESRGRVRGFVCGRTGLNAARSKCRYLLREPKYFVAKNHRRASPVLPSNKSKQGLDKIAR